MADKLLELTAVTYTTNQLVIRVKNVSGASLDKRLVIELSPPAYLVDDRINAAAIAAAKSDNPPGAKSLAGIVTGPQGWSVWVRRETSDSSLFITLINDMDQNARDLPAPVKLPAGNEFTVTIPLDPTASRGHIDLLTSYQQGDDDSIYDKIQLKPDQTTWTPEVELYTKHRNPFMVDPGSLVQVFWRIKDGVSATLRGPLPGGNSERTLSSAPNDEFKLSEGSLDIRVMTAMTYVLEAVVKREGHPNVQVVKMLSLDTKNDKYLYLSLAPNDILPHGLLEINWSAWGVSEVTLNVSSNNLRHTTRTIQLTQQTKGRSYEGSGVMRVSASKTGEKVLIAAESMKSVTEDASVVSWETMAKSNVTPLAMAVLPPKLAVLTAEGLYIAEVGDNDPQQRLTKLPLNKTSTETPRQWLGLATGDKRFVVLRRTNQDDIEVAPYTLNGQPEGIAPLNLPADVRPLVAREGTIFDCVGFRGRVYVVIEAGLPDAKVRRAFSVAFDSATKKSEYRAEPLLEPLAGYRLLTFDGSLYALSRDSGRMFRFDLTTTGTLEEPRAAASAIREESPQKESMIHDGVFVPLARTLAVLSPSSVPSVKSLERFGLHNVLGYVAESSANPDSPQDLVYNPQKNYWARCGHDIDVKQGAVSAYRSTGSRRLWLIQPTGETHTLAVGSESLFVHDYVSSITTAAALPPYLDKKRQFTIMNSSRMNFVAMSEKYRNAGLTGFGPTGPGELLTRLPERLNNGSSATFQLRYNEADPSPIRLRFLVERPAGVKHDYFAEVTFAGRDLATATLVFKRIAEDSQGRLSVAEIPGTTIKFPTDKPIALPGPKLLVDGVRLRVQNATTYQLWREPNQGQYPSEETITYSTPAFSIYAHGAGHLQVNVDFSLPLGIEIASAGTPPRKLISIDGSRSAGLRAEILTEVPINGVEIKIYYVGKSDLNGVYIGDGVANERGDALYIPVSTPDSQNKTHIFKINPENLAITANTHSILYSVRGGFAMPNSIAVTKDAVVALFDNEVWVMDTSLQIQQKMPFLSSTFSAFQAHADGDCCMIETNPNANVGMFSSYSQHFLLHRVRIGKNFHQQLDFVVTSQILLDDVRGFNQQPALPGAPFWAPASMSPMALSPSPVSPRGDRIREAAICISGGVFVVGNNVQGIRPLALQSAGREEAVGFGRDGSEIYCVHSQGDNEGLRVSRVDNKAWKQTHTLSLPRGEGVALLTTDTRQRKPQDRDKVSRSASMVVSGDGRWLFVSHGRSIFKIEAATLTLRDFYKVDLPCRLFYVGWGKPTQDSHPLYGSPSSCTLLYAIGASYTGDGSKAKEFKTQLYKIAIRD